MHSCALNIHCFYYVLTISLEDEYYDCFPIAGERSLVKGHIYVANRIKNQDSNPGLSYSVIDWQIKNVFTLLVIKKQNKTKKTRIETICDFERYNISNWTSTHVYLLVL